MSPTDWIIAGFFALNTLGASLWYVLAGMDEDPPKVPTRPVVTTEGERRHGGPAPTTVYPVIHDEGHVL